MYDAFDLNGSGHLGSSERALMHEVFSGSDATGKGFYRNSQKENTQNTTHRQSDFGPYHFHHREKNPVWTTIGYGALFIPWNANTVFAVATLGVSAGDFLPYIPLIYLTPILVIVYAAVKFKLAKIYDELGYVDVTDRLARDPEKLKAIS